MKTGRAGFWRSAWNVVNMDACLSISPFPQQELRHVIRRRGAGVGAVLGETPVGVRVACPRRVNGRGMVG